MMSFVDSYLAVRRAAGFDLRAAESRLRRFVEFAILDCATWRYSLAI
jgi:hypothetical protein